MKSTKKFFVGLFGLLAVVFSASSFLSACNKDDAAKKATIEFERTSYELNVMQTFQVDMPIVENLEEYTLVWTSSDTSIATVNDKGYVQSEGELGNCIITAAIQGKALSSSVEVSVLYPGEVLPVLNVANLDGDVLNLYLGDTISLKSEVSYLGKTLDCPISYTFSNEGVVSLSGNALTASQEGTTTVTAYASCFGVALRKTFEVNVLPDVVALYDRTDIKLVFGEKENDTLSLTGILLNKAFQSGNIENVGFDVENEQIVSMNEGEGKVTLTALQAGETFVVCTYTYGEGIVCVNRVPVSVAREKIVFDDSLDVDLSLGDVSMNTITQGQVDESAIKLLFVGGVETAFADGKVTDDLPLGPQTVSVYTDKQEYIFNEVFCTKIISTAEDLLNLQKLGGVDPNDPRRDYDYSGYFILANNIDLGTSAFAPLHTSQWGGGDLGREPDKKAGFRGVLDGRGYTVYNGVVGSGGMFGSISTYGIIKNISYVGTDLSKDSKNHLFACNNFGMLENVYVEIVLPRATYWASAEKPAEPYSGFILGYNTGSNKLTNCVFVIIPKDESVVITKDNRLLSDWTNGGKCEINNVYVISEVTGSASISSNTNFCDAVYYNLSELKDHNYASDLSYFSGFGSDWVLSGEYPQRKTVEINGSTTLRVGETTLFSLKTNFVPDEIVWETSNSCVSITDEGEVEALAEGVTVLTCKVNGVPYYITVRVISSEIAAPFATDPNFNYFYDKQGTIKSVRSTTIDEKEYLTIRSGGQWYFSSSIQGVSPIANNNLVIFDVYLDFRGFDLQSIDGFKYFELYIGETLETRKRMTTLNEGLNTGIALTGDDFNDLLAGEKQLFIIDKWLVVNLSTYPIDISFSDMLICELDYTVQSPRETSTVAVTQTEFGWGYTLTSNDWNGIFNFSKDSAITDKNVRAVSVSIKTDSDMTKTLPQVKLGDTQKTAIWESGTWYSFTLTVEEWNKLCNYASDDPTTYLQIVQQYWYDDNKNVSGVPFTMVVEMVEIPYAPQSPEYDTEVVELLETDEYGLGYRVSVKQWYAPINFTADSVITDEAVESVTIYLKSEQELIETLKLSVKIGDTLKATMTEAGTWYSFTLTVAEWNALCGEKKMDIKQTVWESNMNKVSIDIAVVFNEKN